MDIRLRPVALAAFDSPGVGQAWLRPTAFVNGAAAAAAVRNGTGLPLAGGATVFTACEVLARRGDEVLTALAPVAALHGRMSPPLDALSAPRAPWAGLTLDRPLIMGILHVTPDSFYDGGPFLAPEAAAAKGQALAAAGADIIDVGGESTRPGALPVAPEEEVRRILPIIEALARGGLTVSVDTRHTATMRAALAAGARIVNDVNALKDEGALEVVAAQGASAVLMHMQGEPRTMQVAPRYGLASLEVAEYLAERIARCTAAGIPRSRLVVDPGIGFGKALQHNLEILARVALFHATGAAVCVGLSRKSLVGRATGAAVEDRLPGSLAGAVYAASQGVQILRVHDVAETRQALAFQRAILSGG
jgi:dihydropteroate synthase